MGVKGLERGELLGEDCGELPALLGLLGVLEFLLSCCVRAALGFLELTLKLVTVLELMVPLGSRW